MLLRRFYPSCQRANIAPAAARRRAGASLAVLFAACPAALAQRPAAPPADKATAATVAATPKTEPDAYFGIYLRDAKVGYMTTTRDGKSAYQGRPAVRTITTTRLDLNILGAGSQMESAATTWSDAKTGAPLAQENRTRSGDAVTTVKAVYDDKGVSYQVNVTGQTKADRLNLGPGEKWLADPTNAGGDIAPRVGMKFKGKVFPADPAMLKLLDSEVEVVSQETVTVAGQAVPAFKIVDRNPIAPVTAYVTAAGDLLRSDTIMGLQMRKEPKAVALAPAGKKPDFISLVGIKPTSGPITDPRKLTTVRYEVSGVSRALPAADTVQEVTPATTTSTVSAPNATAKTVVVTVHTAPLPEGPTAPLFARAADAPERLRPFLHSTLYVTSEAPEFRRIAKEVVGGEKDAAKAAAKIAAYVHKTLKPDPSISNLRAATDLYKDPRGVCRDYTLFYTAIARAAGLPTKQCVGIAYAGGIFLGHAWPEVWVGTDAAGGDRWVALEPTWGAPFADATHIKLAEGEITDFFNVAADFGNYQIKVLEAK